MKEALLNMIVFPLLLIALVNVAILYVACVIANKFGKRYPKTSLWKVNKWMCDKINEMLD